MKNLKILLPIIGLIFSFSDVYAFTTQEGLLFFDKYKNFANSYDEKLLDMYSPMRIMKKAGRQLRKGVPDTI